MMVKSLDDSHLGPPFIWNYKMHKPLPQSISMSINHLIFLRMTEEGGNQDDHGRRNIREQNQQEEQTIQHPCKLFPFQLVSVLHLHVTYLCCNHLHLNLYLIQFLVLDTVDVFQHVTIHHHVIAILRNHGVFVAVSVVVVAPAAAVVAVLIIPRAVVVVVVVGVVVVFAVVITAVVVVDVRFERHVVVIVAAQGPCGGVG